MKAPNTSPSTRVDTIGAGAAAASGGTLLIVLAGQLPDPWRQILLLAAPPLSVLASMLWTHVQVRLVNTLRDREVDRIVNGAREALHRELADPNTSPPRAQRILANLERLSDVVIARQLQRVEAIAIAPEAEIEEIRHVFPKAG